MRSIVYWGLYWSPLFKECPIEARNSKGSQNLWQAFPGSHSEKEERVERTTTPFVARWIRAAQSRHS